MIGEWDALVLVKAVNSHTADVFLSNPSFLHTADVSLHSLLSCTRTRPMRFSPLPPNSHRTDVFLPSLLPRDTASTPRTVRISTLSLNHARTCPLQGYVAHQKTLAPPGPP